MSKTTFEARRLKATENQYDYLTEKHVIRATHSHYDILVNRAHKANNLYNASLYLVRQALFKKHWLNYNALDKKLKTARDEKSSMIYNSLGHTHLTQQILKQVTGTMDSWRKAKKAYSTNPAKFTGRPKLPAYKTKGALSTLFVDNQTAKLKEGSVVIPTLDNLTIKMQHKTDKIQQVRIVPKHNIFIVEIVYKTNHIVSYLPDNGRYLSIDAGLDNAFTLTSNAPDVQPVAINGHALKAYNQYWNKRKARLTSIHKRLNQELNSHAMTALNKHRYLKLEKFAHEASSYIVDYATSHALNTIVIGYDKSLKRSSNMGKRNNQNFISIPHKEMIDKITYKANLAGIAVITTEESYTSQTSFLDGEEPCFENGNGSRKERGLSPAKRRVHRGLFKSDRGVLINADVNGAYQILKKVVPNAYADGIVRCRLHPIKVDLNF